MWTWEQAKILGRVFFGLQLLVAAICLATAGRLIQQYGLPGFLALFLGALMVFHVKRRWHEFENLVETREAMVHRENQQRDDYEDDEDDL